MPISTFRKGEKTKFRKKNDLEELHSRNRGKWMIIDRNLIDIKFTNGADTRQACKIPRKLFLENCLQVT